MKLVHLVLLVTLLSTHSINIPIFLVRRLKLRVIKYLVQEHPVGKCERLKMKCHHLQRIFSKYGTFTRNIVSDAAKAGWKTAAVFFPLRP